MRVKRYRDKIGYIVEHLEKVTIAPQNDLEKSGIFYELHTSIEAAVDLIAMYIKDRGFQVDDDYSNIDKLAELGISTELASNLKSCNGLRNRLVHFYDNFDEKLVFNAIDDVKTCLYAWIEVVEGFLDESESNSS